MRPSCSRRARPRPPVPGRGRVGGALVAVLGGVLVAGCAASGSAGAEGSPLPIPPVTAAPDEGPELLLEVLGPVAPGEPVEPVDLRNAGSADVEVEVLDDGTPGGALVAGEEGGQEHLAFPREGDDGQASVRLRPAGGGEDLLDPLERPFAFGALARAPAPEESGEGGSNVLQRGTFTTHQYKLQVDRGRASCRVAGAAGEVLLPARGEQPLVLEPERWYRLSCAVERAEDGPDAEVVLTVEPLDAPGERQSRSARGPVGAVETAALPLYVGGRAPRSDGPNDQFHGDVREPFVDVQR